MRHAKVHAQNGKPITPAVNGVRQVEDLAAKNTRTRVIGLKTGRAANSIRNIASDDRISLKPINPSPSGFEEK